MMKKIIRSGGLLRNASPIKEEKIKLKFDIKENSSVYFEYLNSFVRQGNDDALPFTISPDIFNGNFNINTVSELKKSEVTSLYKYKSIDPIENEYDLVTVIPFRGRHLHLEKTIESLIKSYENCDFNFSILVIENSQNPIGADVANKFNNVHYRWIDSSGKIFNKCICHNVGAGILNTKYIHFHDCDLVVPPNFYGELYKSLIINKAVQAFAGRRVHYLDEDNTKMFFSGLDINSIIDDTNSYKSGTYGAPGGSIAIEKELFLKVGGFDSHLFWAYSIEDNFFWKKVEKYNKIESLDSPAIELYHLWHPPGWGKNPYERFEKRFYDIFINEKNYEDYLNTARKIFNEINEHIIKW